MGIHGKIMGKSWENHGKDVWYGKIWRLWRFHMVEAKKLAIEWANNMNEDLAIK
jgi:hypothetical protein